MDVAARAVRGDEDEGESESESEIAAPGHSTGPCRGRMRRPMRKRCCGVITASSAARTSVRAPPVGSCACGAMAATRTYCNALLELYPPLTCCEHRQRSGKRNASGVPG